MNLEQFIIIIIILINIISFVLMSVDKRSSIVKSDRIREVSLFFWAICFGSVGIFLAMHLLRHKNRRWYFNLGIPFLIIQQVIVIRYLFY